MIVVLVIKVKDINFNKQEGIVFFCSRNDIKVCHTYISVAHRLLMQPGCYLITLSLLCFTTVPFSFSTTIYTPAG